MYNYNGQLFDNNLNPVGGMSSDQAAQGANDYLQYEDMKNLQVSPTTPTTEADLNAKWRLASQGVKQAANGGLSFKPPSKTRSIIDMVGGALITYFLARSGGLSGGAATMLGFTAAAANHDADAKEMDRFTVAKKLFSEGGYSEDALYTFMKTGDEKALQSETSSKAADRRQDANNEAQAELQGKRLSSQASIEQSREATQKSIADDRIQAMKENQKGQITQARLGTIDNQIMDNDKPMRDRYTQQDIGWTDAQNQLNIIKDAQKVLNDPNASAQAKQQATYEIQGAIPSLASGVARGESGGNRSLTPAETKAFLPHMGLAADKYNDALNVYNGTLSDAKINALQAQIAGNRHSISNSLYQMNQNEQVAMNKAANGDMTGAYSYTGANLPRSTDEQAATPAELNGQASSAPEGSTVVYNGTTYKTVNGKWEAQ